MGKGNEELKAKIAKIQLKAKSAPTPIIEEKVEAEETEEDSMEALEAQFEAKKQALMQRKATPKAIETPEVSDEDAGIEKAIEEYADDAKFRVEMVFQLVQLNKSLKEIADALKGFANNG